MTLGLNMHIVPANILSFAFNPCKKKFCFSSLQCPNLQFFVLPIGLCYKNGDVADIALSWQYHEGL